MIKPTLRQFNTEKELTDYADMLNEAGGDYGAPEIPVMDSRGNCYLATLQAPGGDGWAFAYYGVNEPDDGRIQGHEDSGWVEPIRSVDEYQQGYGYEPHWPLFGIVQDGLCACRPPDHQDERCPQHGRAASDVQ